MAHDDLEAVLEESRQLGFLGPGEVVFHVEHSLGFVGLLPADVRRVLDLGSGGGLPGLVLVDRCPRLEVTLLDGSATRCRFLSAALERWPGRSARVQLGRAEELGRHPDLRGQFDAVVSRSFGPPAVLAECAAPFLRVGGVVIVSEPPDASGERWPADGLALVGLGDAGRHTARGAGFRMLTQLTECPTRYPRRTGVPAKRPLYSPGPPNA